MSWKQRKILYTFIGLWINRNLQNVHVFSWWHLGVLSFITSYEPTSIFISSPSFRNYRDSYRPVTRWYGFHLSWHRPPHPWISFYPTHLPSHSCDNWGLAQRQKLEHAGNQGNGPGHYVGKAGGTLGSKTKETLRGCFWLQTPTLLILWLPPIPNTHT